jgi:hypothetical protein
VATGGPDCPVLGRGRRAFDPLRQAEPNRSRRVRRRRGHPRGPGCDVRHEATYWNSGHARDASPVGCAVRPSRDTVTMSRRGFVTWWRDRRIFATHRRRIATFPHSIRAAHDHSSNHRPEVLASRVCGCYYCLSIFAPSEIEEWVDPPGEQGSTALCPRCGIDSVIGDRSGFPITPELLGEMNRFWF